MIASGYVGKDKTLGYGFADENGALFIEYKQGKSFLKKKGERFIKTLSRKLRYNLKDYEGKVVATDRFRDDCDEKILYWLDKVKTHMESIEKK